MAGVEVKNRFACSTARDVIRECLCAHPDVEVVAECGDGFEAVKAVAERTPGLVFLDVQMPKLSGFEVVELLGREVAVVFTTACDQYALRAFDLHAVDLRARAVRRGSLRGSAVARAGEAEARGGAGSGLEALVADDRQRAAVETALTRGSGLTRRRDVCNYPVS